MAGFNLSSGELLNNQDINLFSVVSKALFSKQFKTTTYKYCFFKCILDNIFSVDNEFKLSLDIINQTFIEIYWNLISVHNIPQTRSSNFANGTKIERLVNEYCENFPESRGISFDFLDSETQELLIKKGKPAFKQNVIGAFYFDTQGYLYGFSKQKNYIYFNLKSLNFLKENKILLEQLNYYEWLKMCESYLEENHENISGLSLKLEWITKRKSLLKYKNILDELHEDKVCFYCGKKVNSSCHLDHVIPWDFMKKDELWNLVWSCQTCNCSKNDRIPDDKYIQKLKNRNDKLNIDSPDIDDIIRVAKANGVITGWKPKNK